MTSRVGLIFWLAWLPAACGQALAAWAEIRTTALPNGIRVIAVRVPGSTNVSIFSYHSLSLASDGPEQTQWSHLVEHLVVRSTISDLQVANAETLPDHMRLDFYGSAANWEKGLAHHRRWLEGVPFTAQLLEAEKLRVTSECDYALKNAATHKFAVAAWNQAHRHGREHAAIKGDVRAAPLPALQRYRDERMQRLEGVTLCVVGGVETRTVLAVLGKELGSLESSATPVSPRELAHRNREVTWDLNARHLLLTWRIPSYTHADYAALLVGAQWLMTQLSTAAEMKALTLMALAGADLTTPEGNYFFLSALLKPEVGFDAVRQALLRRVQELGRKRLAQLPMLADQLSYSLTNVPNVSLLKAQGGMSPAMWEATAGLQLGTHEFRYGAHRVLLAQRLATVNAADVKRVAARYLAETNLAVCTIRPLETR